MCLNCRCGIPNDDMGNSNNLTTDDIAKAAIAAEMNAQDTIEELVSQLQKLNPEDVQKRIDELKGSQNS